MRVISGIAKGHRLVAPNGLKTRPTTDKIKESLFNIIAPSLYECRFLDLFSGSGAIGIEALSRGASYAAFVENDTAAKSVIKKNLNSVKLIDKAEIYGVTVDKAIPLLQKNTPFDIIFLDPPYDIETINYLLNGTKLPALLSNCGVIIAEHSGRCTVTLTQNSGLVLVDTRKYGSETAISFMKNIN